MDLGTQRQEVYNWLERLYGDEIIPEFELNAVTIHHLHQLSLLSQAKDRSTQLVVDDLLQKTDEYNADAQRVSSILSRLNLGPASLSQSGVSSVRTLAKLGTLLNIRDPSDTSYFLSLHSLDEELDRVREQQESESRHLDELSAKCLGVFLKCSSLHSTFDNVKKKASDDQSISEKRRNDAAFVHDKAKKYKKDIGKLQVQLSKVKPDKSFFHESLVKKSEILKSLQAQLSPLREELKSYCSLPPDLGETKIRIEQLKLELSKLEEEVSKYIDTHVL